MAVIISGGVTTRGALKQRSRATSRQLHTRKGHQASSWLDSLHLLLITG